MQRYQKITPDLSDKSRTLGLNDAKFWAERLCPQPESIDRKTFLKDQIEAVIRQVEPVPYYILDENDFEKYVAKQIKLRFQNEVETVRCHLLSGVVQYMNNFNMRYNFIEKVNFDSMDEMNYDPRVADKTVDILKDVAWNHKISPFEKLHRLESFEGRQVMKDFKDSKEQYVGDHVLANSDMIFDSNQLVKMPMKFNSWEPN
jgi:hypothetical protein